MVVLSRLLRRSNSTGIYVLELSFVELIVNEFEVKLVDKQMQIPVIWLVCDGCLLRFVVLVLCSGIRDG